MQSELKTVREFRKRRAEMQQQLEQLQSSLEASEHEHKTSLSNMEHRYSLPLSLSLFLLFSIFLSLPFHYNCCCVSRFFEEKLRLQKEANRRIAELAEKAHAEAVRYTY